MRHAFTLVEMLIAMVLTLILVAAMAEFYAYVGDAVRDGRAMIELGSQMRAAVQRLKSDFDSITSPVVPWADDGAASGYFEYREGPATDYDANGNSLVDDTNDDDSLPLGNPNGVSDLKDLGVTNLLGDADDYLAFTIRAHSSPFAGRHETKGMVTSQLAEVVWFTGFSDRDGDNVWDLDEPRTIYRRQLVIAPMLGQFGGDFQPGQLSAAENKLHQLQQLNDISLGIFNEVNANNQPVLRIKANSLSDLTRRANRFAHQKAENIAPHFPNQLLLTPTDLTSLQTFVLQGDSMGEDVVLSNVLAFDVQIFDPEAVLRSDAATASDTATMTLEPHDAGYALAAKDSYVAVGTGAYVDLGYGVSLLNRLTSKQFNIPVAQAQQTLINSLGQSHYAYDATVHPLLNAGQAQAYRNAIGRTYDTWAQSYERDGFNQDQLTEGSQPIADEGTNGVDDDNTNGVDDYGERETAPPYAKPARGLQVKIRLYEASTRQMRQATVTTDFLAE